MEDVKEELKKYFQEQNLKDRDSKLACAIGYLEDCDEVDRKQAINIIKDVFLEKM